MKVKLFRLLFIAIVAMGAATACFDNVSQDVSVSDVRRGSKITTTMSAAPMLHEMATKSLLGSRSEGTVYNWNLFVFDGGQLVGKYYKSSGDNIEFDVKLDHPYEYMALANVGNKTGLFGAGTTKAQVAAMELTNVAQDYATNGLPMVWSSSSPITFTKEQYQANNAKLSVDMTRLTAKYEIRVNKQNLSIWSFRVKSLTMKGASSIKPFATSANAVTENNTVSDEATAADKELLNTGGWAVFYPVENVFATPSSLNNNDDPWNKVPGNLSTGQAPTYVEMVAEATLNDGSGITKDVTYRFYLGNDAMKDFKVERNVSHRLTFSPEDASITNGHPGGSWKIEPGPFDENRTLTFSRRTTVDSRFRVRAGTSSAEAIVKNPAGLSYVITKASANVTMRNTATDAVIASGAVTDASSVTLSFADGVDEQTLVHIQTVDGAKYDDLYLDIYNAYLAVTPDEPITWDWNEHGSQSGKSIFVTATVPWTPTVPTGWSLKNLSGGSISGEQAACTGAEYKVYPPDSDYTDIAEDASATLSFSATGTDGDAVTLIRRYKPQVTSGGNTSAELTWDWNQTTPKGLTIASNEDWVVVWPEGDHSHWSVSPVSGSKAATGISVAPVEINDNVSPKVNTFYVVPVRGGVNVEAGKLTVTLTHGANVPHIEIQGSDLESGALKWMWFQAGAKTFTVSSNISWEPVPDDGASASFNITNPGTGVVTVSPKDYNYSTASAGHVGTLTIRGTGSYSSVSQTVSLYQSRYPSIGVTPESREWEANSHTQQTFQVTIDAAEGESYQWEASLVNTPGNAVDFSMTPSEGANNGSFSAGPNSDNENTSKGNSATVTLTLKGDYGSAVKPSKAVSLSQSKKAEFYLTPLNHNFAWTGGQAEFTVVNNQGLSWTPEVFGTNASAFTATRSGNTVNVTVNQNNDFDVKSATLRIKVGGEVKASASLSQEAHPWLELTALDGTSWAYNEYNETGRKRFEVSSSGISSWTPSVDNSEFTVSTDGNIVTVTPKSPNNGTAPRNVCLTVSSNNIADDASDSIDLTQGVNGGMVTGATLQVYNGSAWVTDATFTIGAQQSYRVKVDYLSGSSDYATSGFELASGNSGVVSVNSNKISTTAAGEGSTSVSTTYSGINTSVSVTVQPAAPTYTYTMAIKASGGSYDTEFSISATGDLYLEAWLTQRFTNGSSTPDAGFEPINVSGSCSWYPDDTMNSWPVTMDGGHITAHAYSRPTYTYGYLTVYYTGGDYNVTNSPVEVHVSIDDEALNPDYDITLPGEEPGGGKYPVTLSHNQSIEVKVWIKRHTRWETSEPAWEVYGNSSCGVYDDMDWWHQSSHNLVSRGVVTRSGYGTITITNTNTTGSEVVGYAKHNSANVWTEAITLEPQSAEPKTWIAAYYAVELSKDKIYVDGTATATAYLYTASVNQVNKPTSKEEYGTFTKTSITAQGFSSSKTNVATVTNAGEITGEGKGSSTIHSTATPIGYDDKYDNVDADITVEEQTSNTYKAAYAVVSVEDSELIKGETTSVTATLYVGTYTGPATSAPTDFDVYTWDEGTAVEAVSSNKDVFDKVSGTWTAKKAGEATISAVVDYENYHKHFEDKDKTVEVTVTEINITYGDFKVTVSPASISKGESSFASATIQKYVNGNEDGDPIDVTSLTTFSTSSSFVTKKGTREFEWNGSSLIDLNINIQGTISDETYGDHSRNASLEVKAIKYPIAFHFDKNEYLVASNAAVTNTCNFSIEVIYSDYSSDYVGSGLYPWSIPWSDIRLETYGNNAFYLGEGQFLAVRANSSTDVTLFYNDNPYVCTATLRSENPYELIGINPDISAGEGELYIGFEAEYQYLCMDSAGNQQDNFRVSEIKPTVTSTKISGTGSMTCTWAKLSTSDKFFTITSVSTSKYLFEFYYSDDHGYASISYYVTKNGSSSSYDVDPGDN